MGLSPAELANRSRQSNPAVQTGLYRKEEVKLNNCEDRSVYLAYGRTYATKHGFELVPSMAAALQGRRTGKKVLSYREADIAARAKFPLSQVVIFKAMVMLDSCFDEESMDLVDVGMLHEDVVGIPAKNKFVPETVYEMRRFYNRGVQVKKSGKYSSYSPEQKKVADECMKNTLDILNFCKLPAWPEEVTDGFALELTKPEYMTFDQYNAARDRISKVIIASL